MDMGWASIVVSVVSLIGVIITVKSGNTKTLAAIQEQSRVDDLKLDAKLEKHQAVTDTKIDNLTQKVEKHNNLIERMYRVEGAVAELQHNAQVGGKQ